MVTHGEIRALSITFFQEIDNILVALLGVVPELNGKPGIKTGCGTHLDPLKKGREDTDNHGAVCRLGQSLVKFLIRGHECRKAV